MNNLVLNPKKKSFRRTIITALIALAGIGSTFLGAKTAIAQSSPPIFENVTIAPGFDPQTVKIRGISGGPISASNVAGRLETDTGPCVGFVDEQPDHTLTLTQFFNFLSIQVKSSGDTTLIVQGPGGSWCNDDSTGQNPGISGQWLEGVYKIWIGSYKDQSAQEVEYHPYVIYISE
ncbi:MAG: hypothetical protein WBG70_13550 [Spirulinaceae cyanobacterium]